MIKELISKLPLGKIKMSLAIAGVLAIVFLFLALQFANRKIENLEQDNDRLLANQTDLILDNINERKLVLNYRELVGSLKVRIENLADSLRLRPKEIIKVEYETIIEHDTIIRPVVTESIQKNTWIVTDTGKCHIWEGIAELDTIEWELEAQRTKFEYNNTIESVYYRKRKHKFWFIHWGKWINYHKINPKCGEVRTEIFEFID